MMITPTQRQHQCIDFVVQKKDKDVRILYR